MNDGDMGPPPTGRAPVPRWILRLEAVVETIGGAVSWLGLAMVVGMTVVVVLRYVFNIGATALQEAVLYLHATVFMVGMSYTLKWDEHVRVDVFYRAWPDRARAVVDLLGTLVLLMPFCGFIVWVSLGFVARSIANLEGSPEASGLPGVFVVKALIPVTGGLLFVTGIAKVGRAWHTLWGPR